MFVKKFDFLSPKITLYYKGSSSHSSILSGILSIISVIAIFSLSIYFSLDLIERKNPDTYYLNRFVEDAGEFPINASSLFHYISIGNSGYDDNEFFDFNSFRIIGFNTYFHYYIENRNLENFDHWIYGLCNDEKDIKDINYLLNNKEYKHCACIRKYYSSSDKKYYNTSDKNFLWPIISKGTYNPNVSFYQVIVDKCNNDSLKLILGENYYCKNDSEIDQYFSGSQGFHFYFIDQYIDISNYKEPNKKFFYRIENLLSKESYTVNHLNFNPSSIKTHNGLIFDNIKEEFSYVYERNDPYVYSVDSSNIYMAYCFWLKNRLLSYERIYKRIQDIISIIGGVSEFMTFVSIFLNYLYSKFIVLWDTEKLLFSYIEDYEKKQKDENNNNLNSNNNLIKLQDKQINFESTKSLASARLNINRNKFSNNSQNNQNIIKRNNNKALYFMNENNSKEIIINQNNNNKLEINNDFHNEKEMNALKEEKNLENKNKSIKLNIHKLDFNFYDYMYYILKCGKNNVDLNIYNNFRTKIISEEGLIKNYLNIYFLVKMNQECFLDYKSKFKLEDLINMLQNKNKK